MRRNWSIRTAPETNRKICRHRASFRRPGTKQSDSSDQAGSGSSILQKIDGRTDVYSLGVVMSEMLSGRKPYRAATPIEMLREVMEREPRPLRQIDETLLPNSAWFLDNSDIPGPNRHDNGLHPVGQLTPNCFGSFDTPGNALEWCEDEFTAYGQAIREERDADASGEILDDSRRVLRDGGFGYRACFCRSAARADLRAGDLDLTNGFRVVLSL